MSFYTDISNGTIESTGVLTNYNYTNTSTSTLSDLVYNFPKMITGTLSYINNSTTTFTLPIKCTELSTTVSGFYRFIQNFIFTSNFQGNLSNQIYNASIFEQMNPYTTSDNTNYTSATLSYGPLVHTGYYLSIQNISVNISTGAVVATISGNQVNCPTGDYDYSLLILG